jgi:hypothetical protein
MKQAGTEAGETFIPLIEVLGASELAGKVNRKQTPPP